MRACRVVRQAPVRAVLGACRWRRGQALVRGRGRQNGTPRPRATAWLASACMGAVAGTCGAGVGAPRTTGTGRDATRAGVPLRPKAAGATRCVRGGPGRGGVTWRTESESFV